MRLRNNSWIGTRSSDVRHVATIAHHLLTGDTDKGVAYGVSAGFTVKKHSNGNITFVKPTSKIEVHRGVVRAEVSHVGAVAQMEASRHRNGSSVAFSGDTFLARALEKAFHKLPANVANVALNQKRRIGNELMAPHLDAALSMSVARRSSNAFRHALQRATNRHRRILHVLRPMISW